MIDCHFHLDPALVDAEGLIESMDAHGVSRAALMAPLCPDLAPTFLTRVGTPVFRRGVASRFRPLRRLMRGLYGSWAKDNGSVDVGGNQVPVLARPDNDGVLSAVAGHPDRFFAWVCVNPAGPVSPVEELLRCADVPGVIGAKAHPFWHRYPVKALSDAAALCEERGLSMILHLGPGAHGDFRFLPDLFPGVNFIYAHAGLPYQEAVWAQARERKNVYVDLSSPAYVDAGIAARALVAAGVDKCLFGSDGPYFHHGKGLFEYGVSLAILREAGLDGEDLRRVGGENFLKAIGRA